MSTEYTIEEKGVIYDCLFEVLRSLVWDSNYDSYVDGNNSLLSKEYYTCIKSLKNRFAKEINEGVKVMKKFNDFFETWTYLNETKVFWHEDYDCNCFSQVLDIEVVKVDPETNSIDDNDLLNTKVQVWLEAGEPYRDKVSNEIMFNSHNVDYDCGGDTFEEAIIEMANLVYECNNIKGRVDNE